MLLRYTFSRLAYLIFMLSHSFIIINISKKVFHTFFLDIRLENFFIYKDRTIHLMLPFYKYRIFHTFFLFKYIICYYLSNYIISEKIKE